MGQMTALPVFHGIFFVSEATLVLPTNVNVMRRVDKFRVNDLPVK